MTYRESLAYLKSLNPLGIRLGLDPVRSLLERLGNPQESCPAVLIAGTNGKGSVAAMTASLLTAAGFRTGLYTSPDLIDFRERIRIDGRMIRREEIVAGAEAVKRGVRETVSYFEFLTAMAFLHFQRKKADIAVLEVGLGGRLDATNVVIPLVSVITNISLEHREYLGNTLEQIAREKGGIIKEGESVSPQPDRSPSSRPWRGSAGKEGHLCTGSGKRFARSSIGMGRFHTGASVEAGNGWYAPLSEGTRFPMPRWRWAPWS